MKIPYQIPSKIIKKESLPLYFSTRYKKYAVAYFCTWQAAIHWILFSTIFAVNLSFQNCSYCIDNFFSKNYHSITYKTFLKKFHFGSQ